MGRRMVLRHFGNGEVVLREGEPGDACYVLAHGEVRVLKRDPLNPRGDLLEVARLGSGSLFGEFALLADRRRHATVQAVGSCDIYEIPRRLLRELAATYPAVGPLLEQFYRERLLATLLSTAPFFKPLPEERRGELLARFAPMRAESGQRIVTEGEPAGGLYLIVLGSVEITKRVSDKRSVLLATLGEGAYFGEMSLLKGGVACASATAVGPIELAMMSPRDFYQVVADNPRLWDEVRREANRRQLENNQIVTGETNVV
jgi:CRP-like cAMP-binding protein